MVSVQSTDSSAQDVVDLVARFNQAWNEHDLDRALSMISDDCVFDATSPSPDGTRVVGVDAIRHAWAPIFAEASATSAPNRR